MDNPNNLGTPTPRKTRNPTPTTPKTPLLEGGSPAPPSVLAILRLRHYRKLLGFVRLLWDFLWELRQPCDF